MGSPHKRRHRSLADGFAVHADALAKVFNVWRDEKSAPLARAEARRDKVGDGALAVGADDVNSAGR